MNCDNYRGKQYDTVIFDDHELALLDHFVNRHARRKFMKTMIRSDRRRSFLAEDRRTQARRRVWPAHLTIVNRQSYQDRRALRANPDYRLDRLVDLIRAA